jgi:hypothetical protein
MQAPMAKQVSVLWLYSRGYTGQVDNKQYDCHSVGYTDGVTACMNAEDALWEYKCCSHKSLESNRRTRMQTCQSIVLAQNNAVWHWHLN